MRIERRRFRHYLRLRPHIRKEAHSTAELAGFSRHFHMVA